MTEELKDYLKQWHKIEGIKPKNVPYFIDLFEAFMDGLTDSRDISFDGDGSYFGQQVTIEEDSVYRSSGEFGFEICYCATIVRVYSSNHNGFWHPEYIDLKIDEPYFDKIRNVIYRTLVRLFGLNQIANP